MKKTTLLFAAICFSFASYAQISLGTISDFEDGTTQGWSNGVSSPNPPINIPTGGPLGADDNFLEEVSSGGTGAGSRLLIQNDEDEWAGNYAAAGVTGIRASVKNAGSEDLYLRVAIEGGSDTTEMYSTDSFTLSASQTTWITIELSMSEIDFIIENGTNTVAEVLADVSDIRIVSSENGSFRGDSVAGTLHIDNIEAIAILIGFDDNQLEEVSVFPNPVSDILNINGADLISNYAIYNVVGQLVENGNMISDQLEVASLNDGVYILELSNETGSRTIKFVKR